MTGNEIKTILIVGGGTAGWMAAAALARFMGASHKVTLVESDAIGTVGVGEATIPQIRLFNHGLDIDEDDFIRATSATMKLGIEFDGWARPDQRYIHAFGPTGRPLGMLPFHHYWLRARAEGLAEDFGAFSLNAQAAYHHRFARTRRQRGEGLPDIAYAFHFDAGLYAQYLRDYATRRGVTRIEGRIGKADQHPDGALASVTLEDGRQLEADFFIDCSGFKGLLIGQTLDTAYEDWRHWLPCDRAMAVPSAATGPLKPYTRAMAHRAGWQWRIPLQHRTGNGVVYCSEHMSDEVAEAHLLGNLDGPPQAQPRPLRFTTGHRKEFWRANCLGLGLAAGFMEPLESTSIHLIQSSIARFLKLVPRHRHDPTKAKEFNEQTVFEYERIRDFLILHYFANGREGEPFWDACRTMDIPDSLAHRLELFRASGQIMRKGDELFTEMGWSQVLIGQGVQSHGWQVMADQIDSQQLATMMAQMRSAITAEVTRLPSHDAFIASLRRTTASVPSSANVLGTPG